MKFKLSLIQLFVPFVIFSQVGIGTTTPDPSTALEISSTNKGFLPPRVSLVSASDVTTINSPKIGLIVYNKATAGVPPNDVSPGLYLFSGVKWDKLSVESDFSLIVYTNSTNPNTATIFDTENPPVTNVPSYKNDESNLYISTDGTSWTYNSTLSSYTTYKAATNTAFYLKGTTIDASGNKITDIYRTGAIGIGTSSPVFKLDVNGTGRFSSDIYTGSSLRFNSLGLNTIYKLYSGTDGELSWQTGSAAAAPAFTITDGSTRFTTFNAKAASYYNGTGNFGIGTAVPVARFVVQSGSFLSTIPQSISNLMDNTTYKAVSRTQVASGSNNNAFSTYFTTSIVAQQAHNFSSGTSLPYVLQAAGGNVGIGPTIGPTALLHIRSLLNSAMPTDAATTASTNALLKVHSSSGAVSIFSANTSPYSFGIQVHDVNSGTGVPLSLQPVSGRVGVNNINPGYTFDVTGTINASIESRSPAFITSSDSRLKKNINELQYGVNTIMQLRPVSYEKKTAIHSDDYSINEIGFIAQEIQRILPELISVGSDEEKTLGVNYLGLIPVLTKAMQEQQKAMHEQQKAIHEQQKEIIELKNKINALENREH